LARPASSPAWVKATYGSGGFLLPNTGETPSLNRLLTTVAYRAEADLSQRA
jgi:glycerol kinase